MGRIVISPAVGDALRLGRPVVALESAVITTGLPRTPPTRAPRAESSRRHADLPVNLDTARLLEGIVRDAGATPATVAVLAGDLRIGLGDDELETLAADERAGKVSAGGLAAAMASGATAGATVSATLVACDRVGPVRVFATGGIGGVHRDWQTSADVSGDLEALASTQTCVVSAGAKSILDLAATLQRLESLNVPVVGYRSDHFARFHAGPDPVLPLVTRLDDPSDIAALCRGHWQVLGRPGGVLVSNPVPPEFALDASELEKAVRAAEKHARRQEVSGAALTPFLLTELNRLTEGRALEANLALLASNARLAAAVAFALSRADLSDKGSS